MPVMLKQGGVVGVSEVSGSATASDAATASGSTAALGSPKAPGSSTTSSGSSAVEIGATTEGLATLERRAGRAIILVALSGAVALVKSLHLLADLDDYDESSTFVVTCGVAELVIFVAAVAFFLQWFHRAIVCAKALAPRGQALNVWPSDAVISFFLPVFNLWRPYQKVKRLSEVLNPLELPEPTPEPEPAPVGQYRASGRRAPAAELRWPKTAPLDAWWAAWIFMNVVGRLALRSNTSQSPTAFLLDNLATAVAAVPAVLVLRSISLRLREIGRRRSLPLPAKPFYG